MRKRRPPGPAVSRWCSSGGGTACTQVLVRCGLHGQGGAPPQPRPPPWSRFRRNPIVARGIPSAATPLGTRRADSAASLSRAALQLASRVITGERIQAPGVAG
ncbi:hypothetical protein NDU88_003399 [Pleurodeles waltl]|uniref:Uncharacterized protein n=1 Tax=Pleurodeles waltl TaxID=8319 RepID=A0AAV7TNG9_PLEWA|nr:hypothetical protein NDU88_003399 [Pleurodeles waltl]